MGVIRAIPEKSRIRRGRAACIAVAALFALCLAGCGGRSVEGPASDEGLDINDELFEEFRADETVYVFVREQRAYTVDRCDEVEVTPDNGVEEGGFYKVTADVVLLNGGVAGYYNFPVIKDISEIESVSPFDLQLPSVEETPYGLTLIGDYADGDILLNEYGMKGVWKDGSWVYSYDEQAELDDGRRALCRSGVAAEEITAGANEGVLGCEDYFVLPLE